MRHTLISKKSINNTDIFLKFLEGNNKEEIKLHDYIRFILKIKSFFQNCLWDNKLVGIINFE